MSAATPEKIGFVGLGDQGAPMARAIAEAGFELHVWARRPQSYETISGVPFTRHDTLASLAGSGRSLASSFGATIAARDCRDAC